MLRPAITQLISKNDSYYSLVIGVAKRAREIADELVQDKKTLEEKPVKTAVEELANGKFRILEAKKEEKQPEAPISAVQPSVIQPSAVQTAISQVSPVQTEATDEDMEI